jgi:hypothetical protein
MTTTSQKYLDLLTKCTLEELKQIDEEIETKRSEISTLLMLREMLVKANPELEKQLLTQAPLILRNPDEEVWKAAAADLDEKITHLGTWDDETQVKNPKPKEEKELGKEKPSRKRPQCAIPSQQYKMAHLIHKHGPIALETMTKELKVQEYIIRRELRHYWFENIGGFINLTPSGVREFDPDRKIPTPKPKKEENEDNEIRKLFVKCIARDGPQKLGSLVQLLNTGTKATAQDMSKALELLAYKWFEQEGQNYCITNEARQEVLPQKED